MSEESKPITNKPNTLMIVTDQEYAHQPMPAEFALPARDRIRARGVTFTTRSKREVVIAAPWACGTGSERERRASSLRSVHWGLVHVCQKGARRAGRKDSQIRGLEALRGIGQNHFILERRCSARISPSSPPAAKTGARISHLPGGSA